MVTSSSLRMGMERTFKLLDSNSLLLVVEVEMPYVVLLTELLGKGSAHDVATNAGGGAEVRLAGLAAAGGDGYSIVSISVFVITMGDGDGGGTHSC